MASSWTSLLAAVFFPLVFAPAPSRSYSWKFTSSPQQCSNLTIDITGSGGSPPYHVLVIPFGASPLSDGIEVRRIVEEVFNDSSVSFQLKYPESSQLVAVVSDSTGFGTGGTSVAAQVTTSDDDSCFNSTVSASPDFYFDLDPTNQIVQCTASRVYWNTSQVEGAFTLLGVIPGGDSFVVPQGQLTTEDGDTGFFWTPSVLGGTTLMLIGGDDRGNGTGGSTTFTVSSGSYNSSCIASDSPSSTPGNPAGGTYATNSAGATTGSGDEGSSVNVGAIIGGVIGGVSGIIVLLLLLWFARKRYNEKRSQREKPTPVDLLDENDPADAPAQNDLPQYYQPEPFPMRGPASPTATSGNDTSQTGDGILARPISTVLSDTGTSTTSAGMSGASGTRKLAAGPRQFRAVNVIQHEDAGPSESTDNQEGETIELPPAYTNIRK
ncbi:hypothetical protein FISHEDRAFT_74693 [Fistulina hepatica ATCC 64428]|uniref:Mid2 domain-containing protein n=1 Tax=Fistulina hepatica ATCC 64428 TaxID=1128425 RepID=A0A0D7A9B2_9AGAR|nr:hypothetical protein FISHEDRAFT_74693 [Fistulina hepatica ATCC 64428]